MAGNGKDFRPPRRRSRSRSRREERPTKAKHTSRSRSRETRSRDRSRERVAKESPKDAPSESRAKRDASGSPEPFRQPQERSRDRKRRDRSKDRRRERSRDRSREKDEDGSKERRRDRSKERRRDHSKDRRKDRSRDRYKDRSQSKDRRRKQRSRSPLPYRPSHKRRDHTSRSPSPHKRRKRSPSASPPPRSRKPLPSQEVSFRGTDNSAQPPTKYGGAPPDREKPNFKTTGLLAKEANKIEGTKISLKYHEPAEARKPPPSSQWRLWIFKGADTLGTIELYTQSCWLLGRATEVADIPLEHPSASQQHAAIQFRYIQKTTEDEFGVRTKKGKVKPYIIDLESSNGTELNGEDVEAGRYYELRDKDILRFGGSEREYVIMLPPKE